ncbi:MAG: hypothetical protein V3T86_07625 [Planctomycetota bacterium]
MLDALGLIIGFITVMLILSLVVTAMVQTTQLLFKMRTKNLLVGVTAIIQEELDVDTEIKAAATTDATATDPVIPKAVKEKGKKDGRGQPKDLASEIVTKASPLQPTTRPQAFASGLMGGERTWLTPEELLKSTKRVLDGLGIKFKEDEVERFAKRFEELDADLRKRFLGRIRLITLVWGAVVAIYFQVSAIALLNDLARNPEMRVQAAAYANAMIGAADKAGKEPKPGEKIQESAKESFLKIHTKLKDKLKDFKGTGERTEILAELRTALAGVPKLDELEKEYSEILDRLHLQHVQTAIADAKKTAEKLTAFHLEPWGDPNFYRGDHALQNSLGVLITILFLAFGAPFWFEKLKLVVGLRDALKDATQAEVGKTMTAEEKAAAEKKAAAAKETAAKEAAEEKDAADEGSD